MMRLRTSAAQCCLHKMGLGLFGILQLYFTLALFWANPSLTAPVPFSVGVHMSEGNGSVWGSADASAWGRGSGTAGGDINLSGNGSGVNGVSVSSWSSSHGGDSPWLNTNFNDLFGQSSGWQPKLPSWISQGKDPLSLFQEMMNAMLGK